MLYADAGLLCSTESAPPAAVSVSNGHGRRGCRKIRVSSALAGYSSLPGLGQVAQATTEVVRVSTGEVRTQTRYLITGLPPAQVTLQRLLALRRRNWVIENRMFHVTDDSFVEDCYVLQSHTAGTTMCLLRATALDLLRGGPRCGRSRPRSRPAPSG